MQLLSTAPKRDDKVCVRQKREVFCDCLARHVEVLAKLAQRLAIILVQLIQQCPAVTISEGLEDSIHVVRDLRNQMVACQAKEPAPRRSMPGGEVARPVVAPYRFKYNVRVPKSIIP